MKRKIKIDSHNFIKKLSATLVIVLSCSPVNNDHKKLISDIMTKPEQVIEILNNCPFTMSDQIKNNLKINNTPTIFSCCINQFNKNYKITETVISKSDFGYKTLFVFVDNDSINWPIEFQFRTIGDKFILLNAIVLHDLCDGECIGNTKK